MLQLTYVAADDDAAAADAANWGDRPLLAGTEWGFAESTWAEDIAQFFFKKCSRKIRILVKRKTLNSCRSQKFEFKTFSM